MDRAQSVSPTELAQRQTDCNQMKNQIFAQSFHWIRAQVQTEGNQVTAANEASLPAEGQSNLSGHHVIGSSRHLKNNRTQSRLSQIPVLKRNKTQCPGNFPEPCSTCLRMAGKLTAPA